MMNEKESFIIEDLDDHHLVIKAEHEYRVRKELETEVRSSFLLLCSFNIAPVGEEYIYFRTVTTLTRTRFHWHITSTLW